MTQTSQTSETELIVLREEGPTRGRYVIHLAPGQDAEMTFRKEADGSITIDHTGVPPAFEGRGIAARLVNKAASLEIDLRQAKMRHHGAR